MRRALRFDWARHGFGPALLAVLLGATAGLFISGYWLIDLFPAGSRLLIAFSAVAGVTTGLAYHALMRKVTRALMVVPGWEAVRLLLVAGLVACFLFFAGTSKWQDPGRYIGFLLPREQFRLVATAAQQGASIAWINTSLGDVSYDTLISTGWARRGEQMVLQDPSDNSLQWSGRAGDRIEIVFSSPEAGGDFQIQWTDRVERIRLGAGKTSYERNFAVPHFASRQFVLALGLLHFWLLCVAALLTGSGRLASASNSLSDSRTLTNPVATFRSELPILAVILGLALLLRVFHLGAVFPAVDEYYHLIAADQILGGASIDSVYPRGLWIVTMPVALALRLLGHEVWAARAAGVFFNVLALVPLYVIARKMSKAAAVAATLLYATSPWIITFARVAREYAYYPLYFYLIVLAMITLVESIPPRFVARQHWRRLPQTRIVVLTLVLLVPPIFALRIDWLSTFRTILIAYLVLGVFLVARFDWRARENWPILSLAALALAGAGWYFYQEQLMKLLLVPRVNSVPLNYFFPNPPQQWYYGTVGLVAALAVAIAVAIAIVRRQSSIVPLFFVSLLCAYLAVFSLFSRTFFHTRHLISTQFWFIVVAGAGLYWLWEWLRRVIPWKGRAITTGLAFGLAVLVANPQQILLPTLSRDPDMPISEDYLHDMSAVQGYLLSHVQEGDALISTVYGLYATWEGTPGFGNQYRIHSGTSRNEIASIVGEEDSGWIVIDSIRLEMSALTERSLASLPQMEYIGSFGDEHVWRWGRPLAGSPASGS
jgi:hypothetical protein